MNVSEDMIRLPRVMILSIPSSNMSIAFLDLSIENQKGGWIKQNQIISFNTVFHEWLSGFVQFRIISSKPKFYWPS